MKRFALAVGLALSLAASTGCGRGQDGVDTASRSLRPGQVVDGVPCLGGDLPMTHTHVHLGIWLDGVPVAVPAGIGVGRPWGVEAGGFVATGGCWSWIHTHDSSGVVHLMGGEGTTFTLGQLFAVWGRPLGPSSALGYQGALAAYVNGERYRGDPRQVPLDNLANIALELGTPPKPQPPAAYDFAALTS